MCSSRTIICLACLTIAATVQSLKTNLAATDEPEVQNVNFVKDVAPILSEHCIRCHYPGNEKGDLSLATAETLLERDYLVPGKPDESYLVELITTDDNGKAQMPQEGPALPAKQVELVRSWIKQGAIWPEDTMVKAKPKADLSWWSLQPLRINGPPKANGHAEFQAWQSPIDRYLALKLRESNLTPNKQADRRSVIRRLSYDLTGLPPTPAEIEDFESSPAKNAYEKLVDRLLASPRYGERWGRHWLDVVRFGESTGYEQNIIVDEAWPFRDYVIRSFNDDKPMNQFIREHLAGDVLQPDNPDVKIGSAFLVNGAYDTVGNQDAIQAAQIRADTIDEVVRATSEAFLGLTMGCARCHDHKFDPIQQRDYYRLYATFAGLKHGSGLLSSPADVKAREEKLAPLNQKHDELNSAVGLIEQTISQRIKEKAAEFEDAWTREAVNRTGTEERFDAVEAKFVKLTCVRRDDNAKSGSGFRMDEFEIWSAGKEPRNVALASNGSVATGPSRNIEDFKGAYAAKLTIDGQFGARFLSSGNYLQIELKKPTLIDRVFFSSARNEPKPEQGKFSFVADFRIEVSLDGEEWQVVATGDYRKPASIAVRDARIRDEIVLEEEKQKLAELRKQIREVKSEIANVPGLRRAWIGSRDAKLAAGPFNVFLGGDPLRKGETVLPSSPSFLGNALPSYEINDLSGESERRIALANWITHDNNALVARVLVNRVWQYHFGTGIVSTPSDFGYMGEKPSHPELLDYLADQFIQGGWKLKQLHKQILMSQAYRQSSEGNERALRADADSRLLWRFPPRRLAAEEIRDSMIYVSGQLREGMYGKGFRLYKYLRDNVATYVPLDEHGPETYRRSVYHQNARACVTDLFSEFDQPDCAFSAAKRSETTSPLQALTALNHSFTRDMARHMAERVEKETNAALESQATLAMQLAFGRDPDKEEIRAATELIESSSLAALCRVLLNTSEFIWIR